MSARTNTSLDLATARAKASGARGREQRQAALAREIRSAGVLLFDRWYVWVENPFGKLSLRRTGLGVPGK